MTSSKTSREAPVFPARRELPIWAQWLIFITALLYIAVLIVVAWS
jgi:hypothetical protein